MSRERGGLVRPGASRTGKPGTHGACGMMADRCVHPVVHNDPLSSGTRWNARAGQAGMRLGPRPACRLAN
jgi:hypothetical protein